MQTGDKGRPGRGTGIRRRDRHGRGLRGVLVPPDVPLYRTRAQQFDDLVLEAVARLEPRWEAQLATVEFAVEEIPPPSAETAPGMVPLGRLETGSPGEGTDSRAGGGPEGAKGRHPAGGGTAGGETAEGTPGGGAAGGGAPGAGAPGGGVGRPARIVVYRRPLMARSEGEEDLGELVFEVVVEEFAHLLGVDPEDVDPDYSPED